MSDFRSQGGASKTANSLHRRLGRRELVCLLQQCCEIATVMLKCYIVRACGGSALKQSCERRGRRVSSAIAERPPSGGVRRQNHRGVSGSKYTLQTYLANCSAGFPVAKRSAPAKSSPARRRRGIVRREFVTRISKAHRSCVMKKSPHLRWTDQGLAKFDG